MWDWGHRLVTHTGNTSFQISKGRRGGGHHAGPTKESDTQATCPAVPRDPGSPRGLLAVLIVPAQVQSRQLNHSTPTHKAAPSPVPSVHRRVQLGLQATENSNSPPCLRVGDTGACRRFRVAKSSGTHFIISEHVHLPQQVV